MDSADDERIFDEVEPKGIKKHITRTNIVLGLIVAIIIIVFVVVLVYLYKSDSTTTTDSTGGKSDASSSNKRVGLAQRRPFMDVNRPDGHSIGLDGVVRDILKLHEATTNQYALFLRGEWGTPSFLEFRALASDILMRSRSHGGQYPKSILEVLDAILVRIDNDPTQLSVPDSDAWKLFHGQLYDLMDRCSKYLEAHMQVGLTVGGDGRGQMSTAADAISAHLSRMADTTQSSDDPDSSAMMIDTTEMNMLEEMDYIDGKLVAENPELSGKSAARYKEVETRRSGKGLFPRARQGGYIPETAAELSQTLYDVDTRRNPVGRIPGGTSTAYDVESTFTRFPINSVNRSIYGPQF
jgi:hypothetical protein